MWWYVIETRVLQTLARFVLICQKQIQKLKKEKKKRKTTKMKKKNTILARFKANNVCLSLTTTQGRKNWQTKNEKKKKKNKKKKTEFSKNE